MNDHQDLPEPQFGERVTFSRDLVRAHEERMGERFGRPVAEHWRTWKRSLIEEHREGIVIGSRTLMNLERKYIGYEEGWENNLTTAERFKAYLIAYDMRRKPVLVLPADIRR
jgi:hypothetical protein